MFRLTIRRSNKEAVPSVMALICGAMMLVAVFRFPVFPGMIRISMDMLFEIAAALFVAAALYRYVNRWAAAYLGLAVFAMCFPVYGKWSYLQFQIILYSLLWYAALVAVMRLYPGKGEEAVLDAMCIIALVNVPFQILQFFDIAPLIAVPTPRTLQTVGFMTNPNEVSALLAFCAPAFWRGRWKWGLPAIGLGLVLAGTSGGIVSLAIGVLAYIALSRKWKLLLTAVLYAVAGIIVYFTLADAPGFERWAVWRKGLALCSQHWIFGSGLGHWPWVIQLAGFDVWWTMAHNFYLHGLFEMGIGFLVIVGGYIWTNARRYRAEALLPAAAFCVIAVNISINFAMHVAVTRMIIIAWLAVLEVSLKKIELLNPSEAGNP